jgi:signal transduction histidine kinase
VIWPDGSEHWIDVHGSAYVSARASEQEPPRLRFLGIIADITLRKQTEATLRDADLRKDEFLATLAHELRNPLAPIRNAVQIMQLSRDEAMHDNARRIIERQLKQMVHLVDDLLDVSRISQGKVELRLEQVDVADAVLDAIETSRPLIDAGRHHLTTKLAPPRALMVDADLTRVCQIVANLLNNAAKYTPEGGHIQVLAERDGDEAVITVQDSGIGLTADMLPRVFDMFAQVDRSVARAQGGLGIGLALVKRLVEMHGGSVAATSDGPDLRLPLRGAAAVDPLPDAAPHLDGGQRAGGGGDGWPARAGGRRQPRQRREPVAADADPRLPGGRRPRRRRGRGGGHRVAAGRRADGHRHAAHGRAGGGAAPCARCPAASASGWSRSAAGARTRTGASRARRASTTTSSSRWTSRR